jgi:hypothetical protein
MPRTLEEMSAVFDRPEVKRPAAVRAPGRDCLAAFAFGPEHEKPLFTNLNKVFTVVEVHD